MQSDICLIQSRDKHILKRRMLQLCPYWKKNHPYTYSRKTDHRSLEVIVKEPLERLNSYKGDYCALRNMTLTLSTSKKSICTLLTCYHDPIWQTRTSKTESKNVNMASFLPNFLRFVGQRIKIKSEIDPKNTIIHAWFTNKSNFPATLLLYFHVRDRMSTQKWFQVISSHSTLDIKLAISSSPIGINGYLRCTWNSAFSGQANHQTHGNVHLHIKPATSSRQNNAKRCYTTYQVAYSKKGRWSIWF